MIMRKELTLDATVDNIPKVTDFLTAILEEYDFPMKTITQIMLAVEEIFVNIAHYAYDSHTGSAYIECDVSDGPLTATITLSDRGTPYNPLTREDPDITLSADERDIGGLGVYIVKQSMDDVAYHYDNGKNILKIVKRA